MKPKDFITSETLLNAKGIWMGYSKALNCLVCDICERHSKPHEKFTIIGGVKAKYVFCQECWKHFRVHVGKFKAKSWAFAMYSKTARCIGCNRGFQTGNDFGNFYFRDAVFYHIDTGREDPDSPTLFCHFCMNEAEEGDAMEIIKKHGVDKLTMPSKEEEKGSRMYTSETGLSSTIVNNEDLLGILKLRYVKGEITRDEFEQIKHDILQR
jgi:hypothetical protein